MNRILGRYICVALAGILIAGCDASWEREAVAGVDMREAAIRSDAMLDATINAINPEIQWAHGDTTTGRCQVKRRRTVMTAISENRRGNFLGLIEQFWKKSGYQIIAVNDSKKYPDIFARTPDGFGVHLAIGDKGQAFFVTNSPCVEKSEVPDPTTPPNGPAYTGVEIPRPNVHSDFWSAEAPVPSPSSSTG